MSDLRTIKSCAKLKIARISTFEFFVETQLRRQIVDIVAADISVTVIASESEMRSPIVGARYKSIKIKRNISLLWDFIAVIKLCLFFRHERFDVVHSTTPKAGLLTAIAGYVSKVPIRVHTYTGQVWVEKHGMVRLLSKLSDQVIGYLNTQCYADSASQIKFLLVNRIAQEGKIKCLGSGSLSGVDLARFNQGNYSALDREVLRAELGIPKDHKVVSFIGRCTRDKGISELVHAFDEINHRSCKATLLMVGPVEGRTLMELKELRFASKSHVRFIGHTPTPEKYLSITDILVLPSYREGFGTVVIEAAAMGIPAIGTNIYGLKDAIVDNETGLLVPSKNVTELARAIEKLLSDNTLRSSMGCAARVRAINCFSSEYVNQLVIAEYFKLATNSDGNE